MMEIDTDYLSKLDNILLYCILSGAENATVAGGAIRDMLFQKPIKDIDIFYNGEIAISTLNKYFNGVEGLYTKYEDSSFTVTHEIKDNTLFPIPIQLIQCQEDVKEHIKEFPAETGRVFLDKKGLHNLTPNVFNSEKTKTILFDKPTNIKYLAKYLTKYSDYKIKFLSEEYKPEEYKQNSTVPESC